MRRITLSVLLSLLMTSAALAQKPAIAFCSLDHDLDFKTLKAGDKVSLHLTRDLTSGGKVFLQHGTKVSASVADTKDANSASLILEKAVLKSGKEVPLMGIIAAVAQPKGDLTDDPFYGMNHSTEVSQHASNDPAVSTATSGAAARTAILKGTNDPHSNLTEDSQGAIGISGLSLSWILDKAPATTVLTSKKKNMKLRAGTEILLRMAPPEIN